MNAVDNRMQPLGILGFALAGLGVLQSSKPWTYSIGIPTMVGSALAISDFYRTHKFTKNGTYNYTIYGK